MQTDQIPRMSGKFCFRSIVCTTLRDARHAKSIHQRFKKQRIPDTHSGISAKSAIQTLIQSRMCPFILTCPFIVVDSFAHFVMDDLLLFLRTKPIRHFLQIILQTFLHLLARESSSLTIKEFGIRSYGNIIKVCLCIISLSYVIVFPVEEVIMSQKKILRISKSKSVADF